MASHARECSRHSSPRALWLVPKRPTRNGALVKWGNTRASTPHSRPCDVFTRVWIVALHFYPLISLYNYVQLTGEKRQLPRKKTLWYLVVGSRPMFACSQKAVRIRCLECKMNSFEHLSDTADHRLAFREHLRTFCLHLHEQIMCSRAFRTRV